MNPDSESEISRVAHRFKTVLHSGHGWLPTMPMLLSILRLREKRGEVHFGGRPILIRTWVDKIEVSTARNQDGTG